MLICTTFPLLICFSGNLCIYEVFVSLRPNRVFTWRLENIWIASRDMHLSTSPGISLITWFFISASKTPPPVIKCDIKHTIVKHKIKTIFLSYYILYFLVKVKMAHLHAKYTYLYHNYTEWICCEILFMLVP